MTVLSVVLCGARYRRSGRPGGEEAEIAQRLQEALLCDSYGEGHVHASGKAASQLWDEWAQAAEAAQEGACSQGAGESDPPLADPRSPSS